MSETTRAVPEISLMSYIEGSTNDKVKFADDLYAGLKEYGFIILTDHNVTEEIIADSYTSAKAFFDLDEATKKGYVSSEGGGQRGYTPFGTEHAKDNPHKDLKEFYHVGRQVAEDHKFRKFYPNNIWPSEVSEFQKNLGNIYSSLDMASQYLLEALGKSLDVSDTYFKDMIDTGNSILRAIHYPPVGEAPPAGSIRAAAHGDINLITILMGATAGGLQLQDKDGSWLDVNTKPGQLVVDSGDMMSRITNGTLPATIHRVINPEESKDARFSMPFFVHPHPEAMLECIPSCVGDGAKFPPITAHDCLVERLKDIGLM
jgi:isopenicillin N synthase-like dioxygenase